MSSPSQLPWKPLLVAAVLGVALGAWSLRQQQATDAKADQASGGAANVASSLPVPVSISASGSAQAANAADIDAWLAGARGEDAAVRLASIKALAQAPRDRALPVLSRIAERGMLSNERLAAIDSLDFQAQQSGDADDAIHGVLRTIAVDGRDDRLSERARRLLESIDASASAAR
jgi:hypothetical protein